MLNWQWPYLLVLLPMPLLVRWLAAPLSQSSGAIRVPFYRQLTTLSNDQANAASGAWLNAILIWLIWLSLVVAVARPTWVGEPVSLPQDRRDLMLAVDISRSMQEQDMLVGREYTNRVTAVKAVVGDFVKQRSGDRLGLILFGEQSYLQTPLTFDSKTVNQQLQEAQLGFAGNATAIGDAIGLAVKRLRDRPAESRVLILLTDGANTAGTDPLQAAAIAAEANIRIHTVGIGADSKRVKDFFGRVREMNPARDLDEKTLVAVAEKTGGQYFRARNPDELSRIYTEIEQLEPIPEDQTFRPKRSLLYWPVGVALLLSALLLLVVRRGL